MALTTHGLSGTASSTASTSPALRPRQRGGLSPSARGLERPFTLEEVLELIERPSRVDANNWTGLCPAHNDTQPSFSISNQKGNLLLYCHAGCKFEEILTALRNRRKERLCRPRPASNTTVSASVTVKPQVSPSNTTPPFEIDDNLNKPDWDALNNQFQKAISKRQRRDLANELGVGAKTLIDLGLGWDESKQCFTFPERNATGQITGIGTRDMTGQKRCVKASVRGVYLPDRWRDIPGPLYICEGPSDTAALLTIGRLGIGRPSATGGTKVLVELLAQVGDREIIVVGENDCKADGKWPGRTAAESLANQLAQKLNRRVGLMMPPENAKDVREWLKHKLLQQRKKQPSRRKEKKNARNQH